MSVLIVEAEPLWYVMHKHFIRNSGTRITMLVHEHSVNYQHKLDHQDVMTYYWEDLTDERS
jgi:hypothetical protein